jgi:hypothetical protein
MYFGIIFGQRSIKNEEIVTAKIVLNKNHLPRIKYPIINNGIFMRRIKRPVPNPVK